MKKMAAMVVLGVALVGGFAVNSQAVEPVMTTYNGDKLHWQHEDKYPTAEQQEKFHIFKGQFPLEDAPLVNQR